MKATVQSTSRIVQANGIPCRVWSGETADGVAFEMLVVRVAVSKARDTSAFEAELREVAPPSVDSAFPARLIL